MIEIISGGDFDLTVKHELDQEIVNLVYKAFNPNAVKLTELALKYDEDPKVVLDKYKKVRKELLD